MSELDLLEPTTSLQPKSLELLQQERKGLPINILKFVQDQFDLSEEEILHLLSINARTLLRRRAESKKLDRTESATLLDIGRVLLVGQQVFGEPDKLNRWLRRPNPLLDEATPLSVLDTSTGRGLVRDLIGRIEHGVFA